MASRPRSALASLGSACGDQSLEVRAIAAPSLALCQARVRPKLRPPPLGQRVKMLRPRQPVAGEAQIFGVVLGAPNEKHVHGRTCGDRWRGCAGQREQWQ